MKEYSDLDTSSESEYDSDQESTHSSNYDEDEPSENLEPELSEPVHDEYENAWGPQAQLQARLKRAHLAQLNADIKAWAELPDPAY